MSGNTAGPIGHYRICPGDVGNQMRVYDSLPPILRRRLADGSMKWDATWVAEKISEGWPNQQIIRALDQGEGYLAAELERELTATPPRRAGDAA